MKEVDDTRTIGLVTPSELEDVALRVAQATSNLRVLANASEDEYTVSLHNALALVVDYLGKCASDLSELHRRSEEAQT